MNVVVSHPIWVDCVDCKKPIALINFTDEDIARARLMGARCIHCADEAAKDYEEERYEL